VNGVESGPAASGDAAQLLRMLQFGDSMLPVGAFAFSGGLESAIQKGVVRDAATLQAFARIDELVYARRLSSENRAMAVRMGRKFAELAVEVTGAPLMRAWRERIAAGGTPGCYPVALAAGFASQGLTARATFAVHQYGVASMILGAALRLMKIGHVDTQRMLYRLNADVAAAYETAAAARLSDMAGYAPLTEILAAVHVKVHVRLFMN
jgi:urease accessory protein